MAFFLLAVTSMTSLAPALAEPTSSEAVGSGVLKLWSPASTGMVSSLTGTRAVQIAKDFDLILASPKTFAPYMASMHAANPKLVVLGRINGTFAGRNQGGTYPASWYLYDGEGNKVRSLRYGTYMMNDSVQGWIDSRTKLCASVADGSHYDGCYLDSLGSSPIGPGYVTGAPINPSTNKPWTYTEWLAVTTTLASKVRTAVAPRTVEANGLTDGPRYFPPIEARVLFNAMDAVIAEGFLRNGRAPLSPFPSASDWKQNVDMLADAEARGKTVLAVTKLWNTGTQAEKDAWHKLALATFLMGAKGLSRFYLSYDEAQDPTFIDPWWRVALGSPTASYALSGGVYQRSFTNGKVLVNPFGTTVTVPLSGSYRKLEGTLVTSVKLTPSRPAQVLIKA